jgi:hypothetical protein
MPEKRLAQVEKEFGILKTISKAAPTFNENIRSYSMLLHARAGKPGMDAAIQLRKKDVLATLDLIHAKLGEIKGHGKAIKGLRSVIAGTRKAVKGEDALLLAEHYLPALGGYAEKFNRLKTSWLVRNNAELRKALGKKLKLPRRAELFTEDTGVYHADPDELDIYLYDAFRKAGVRGERAKSLRNRFQSTIGRHKEIILVNPFEQHARVMTITPRLPRTYALIKRLHAEENESLAMSLGSAPARRGGPRFTQNVEEASEKVQAALSAHGVRVIPQHPEEIIAHEKEHAKNSHFFNQLSLEIQQRHTIVDGERAWQLKLLNAFDESFPVKAELDSIRKGMREGRLPADIASPGLTTPHQDFEHDLGELLGKAYDIARIKPAEAKRMLTQATDKGDLARAARGIARRALKKSEPIARSILVMIGDEQPAVHARFRESLATLFTEQLKKDERDYNLMMRLRMRGK